MSTQPHPVKTRTELMRLFATGRVPVQADYEALIYSLVHRDDLTARSTPAALPPAPRVPATPPADGWHRAAARMGSYDPARGAMQVQSAVNLAPASAPADGNWHTVLPALNDCYGFELAASASGRVDSSNHALTHAIVLCTLGAKGGTIRQTATCTSWDFRRKIRLKWIKRGQAWDLCIATGVDLGRDDQGMPVRIQYHVTRFW